MRKFKKIDPSNLVYRYDKSTDIVGIYDLPRVLDRMARHYEIMLKADFIGIEGVTNGL